jgi:magnesium transporter
MRLLQPLTVVSIIFLPLTFITGFCGMNFGWMTQIIGSADTFVLLGVILPTLCVALALARKFHDAGKKVAKSFR